MKKFRFKLDPLIKVREHKEKMAQLAVAAAGRETAESQEKVVRMRNRVVEGGAAFEAAVEGGISAERFLLHAEYLGGIDQDIRDEEGRLQELMAAEKEKREALAARSVEKQILENLRERKKDLYYKEMLDEEQKGADDMTVLRKARDINA